MVGYNPKRVKVVNKNFVTVVLEENVVALGRCSCCRIWHSEKGKSDRSYRKPESR